MGQNPNRTTSEHPNPTTKIGSKMGGAPTPKWDTIGFDLRPCVSKPSTSHFFQTLSPGCDQRFPASLFLSIGEIHLPLVFHGNVGKQTSNGPPFACSSPQKGKSNKDPIVKSIPLKANRGNLKN